MKEKKKSHSVMVRLPSNLHAELSKLADKYYTTHSEIIRRSLVEFIMREKEGEK